MAAVGGEVLVLVVIRVVLIITWVLQERSSNILERYVSDTGNELMS